MKRPEPHVTIIGAGLVGLATGLALVRRRAARVTILEKESRVAAHQSSHNSGVLHAGLYYKPGSKKALLSTAGRRRMVEFCREHGIAHDVCGKLVVATTVEEAGRLAGLRERGMANGLQGLQWLDVAQMREIEPNVAGVAALHVPEEGIADYPAVAARIAELIRAEGGEIVTGCPVTRMQRRNGVWEIDCPGGARTADFIIGCAGLHADRVARMGGLDPQVQIVPFRGEYYALQGAGARLVRNLIYPVPDTRFPFLGVHFTRMIHGGVEAGPNAVLALSREAYAKGNVNIGDAAESIRFPGIWRFAFRYSRETIGEVRRSFSKALFTRALQRLVPAVQREHLGPGGSGVRAMAMRADGSLVEDFLFEEADGAIHVLNAPSPAATASLVIGEEIAARAMSR
jgi:L-2-hydroxyglutarate oxidase LhgO